MVEIYYSVDYLIKRNNKTTPKGGEFDADELPTRVHGVSFGKKMYWKYEAAGGLKRHVRT